MRFIRRCSSHRCSSQRQSIQRQSINNDPPKADPRRADSGKAIQAINTSPTGFKQPWKRMVLAASDLSHICSITRRQTAQSHLQRLQGNHIDQPADFAEKSEANSEHHEAKLNLCPQRGLTHHSPERGSTHHCRHVAAIHREHGAGAALQQGQGDEGLGHIAG